MIRSGTFLDLDMQTLARLVGEAWVWWTDELAAMLPRWLTRPARRLTGPLAYWRDGRGLVPGSDGITGPVTVLIDADHVLTRTIEQPTMSAADLQRLVALDIDRLTPFAADQVYADTRIDGPGAQPGTISARIAAIPKTLGQAIAAAAGEQGMTLAAVGLADSDERALAFDFLPALRRDGSVPAVSRARGLWWGLVALGFAVNLGLFVYRDIDSLRSLDALVDQQRLAATAARKLAASLQREDALRADLVARRRRGDALGMLALTARVMPPGAWVQRLSWTPDQLRISGYKPPEADLLRLMRGTGRFVAIRTTAADVATESSNGQPFDITAMVVPR